MTIPFTKHISLQADTLVQEIEGESVILNLKNECYFGLDDVGTRMWKALTASDSIQSAYELLQTEYNADPNLLREDLHSFIEKLIEHYLVEISGD